MADDFKSSTRIYLEEMFRILYEVDPKLSAGKIAVPVSMESEKAHAFNKLGGADEIMQDIHHNLKVASTGATMLRNQDEAVDTKSVDTQIQTLSGDIAARMQEAQKVKKAIMDAYEDKKIQAVTDTKAANKNVLAKGMEDNLVRQQAEVKTAIKKYEDNMDSTFKKSTDVAKNVSHAVQATGQLLPQAPAAPKATR